MKTDSADQSLSLANFVSRVFAAHFIANLGYDAWARVRQSAHPRVRRRGLCFKTRAMVLHDRVLTERFEPLN